MYVNEYPVGYIGLRTKNDENWNKWSGNFYYVIRLSERNKGYGAKMLGLALNEFKKMGFKEVFSNSSSDNYSSAKVIEKEKLIELINNKLNLDKLTRLELENKVKYIYIGKDNNIKIEYK